MPPQRFLTLRRPPRPKTQRRFRFIERSEKIQRKLKWFVILATLCSLAAGIALTSLGRLWVGSAYSTSRIYILRNLIGAEPTRDEIDAQRERVRQNTLDVTRKSLERFYSRTTPEIRRMFDASAMDPEHALIGIGRPTNGFLLSSRVFEADDHGRSYRLRPNVRSVWLRQVTLHEGPFGLFLVPDEPAVHEAAEAAHAIVDATSRQLTNSWGLRGPEPDVNAPLRGIVLGDSFMQGMFNDDEHTPPLELERELEHRLGRKVSVLNTGHIGYAPEQYFRTLEEYGPRFNPHFVVISVCPNDFGEALDVITGSGDDWDEAAYWLGEILRWARGLRIPALLVTVPVDMQMLGTRRDAYYPGRVSNIFPGSGLSYLDPFDIFIDEHLRQVKLGAPAGRSVLFNSQINDNHFSPLGAKLRANAVATRLLNLLPSEVLGSSVLGD